MLPRRCLLSCCASALPSSLLERLFATIIILQTALLSILTALSMSTAHIVYLRFQPRLAGRTDSVTHQVMDAINGQLVDIEA